MEMYITFLCGFFGGACLEVKRVYTIILKGGDFYYPKEMGIISFIMACVGGGLALIFGATNPINPIGAFWIGISAPALLEKFLGTPPV